MIRVLSVVGFQVAATATWATSRLLGQAAVDPGLDTVITGGALGMSVSALVWMARAMFNGKLIPAATNDHLEALTRLGEQYSEVHKDALRRETAYAEHLARYMPGGDLHGTQPNGRR